MSDTLYSPAVLAHARTPRHAGLPAHANRHGHAVNRLCGDAIEVGCVVEAGKLREIGFRAEGCAILLGTADLMAEALAGYSPDVARTMEAAFDRLLEAGIADATLPKSLHALSALAQYPARRACAALPWQALLAALDQAGEGA